MKKQSDITSPALETIPFAELPAHDGALCSCGRRHFMQCGKAVIGSGVLKQAPALIRSLGGHRCYILADPNTYKAAGKKLCALLAQAEIPYVLCLYKETRPEPDEHTAGQALMHFDPACDVIVSVGGGVMNDTGKLLASVSGRPYMIAATAPSMDGFASATSSMARDGLKVSIPTKAPDCILGDLDILAAAPMKLIVSGLGDMLAKYVSICEWRIAHLLVGDPYCPHIAALVRNGLQRCVDAGEGLLRRDKEAVRTVMEGMMLAGYGMNYAGLSRPASGMEHYLSHIWDMRALAFGTTSDLHGIQCAAATVVTIRAYQWLAKQVPNPNKALAHAAAFDRSAWEEKLRSVLGKGAEPMIALENREHKFDPEAHRKRLGKIIMHWNTLLSIFKEELPDPDMLITLLHSFGMPALPSEIGFSREETRDAFLCAMNIRDKYVLGRLLWDLGLLEEYAETEL